VLPRIAAIEIQDLTCHILGNVREPDESSDDSSDDGRVSVGVTSLLNYESDRMLVNGLWINIDGPPQEVDGEPESPLQPAELRASDHDALRKEVRLRGLGFALEPIRSRDGVIEPLERGVRVYPGHVSAVLFKIRNFRVEVQALHFLDGFDGRFSRRFSLG